MRYIEQVLANDNTQPVWGEGGWKRDANCRETVPLDVELCSAARTGINPALGRDQAVAAARAVRRAIANDNEGNWYIVIIQAAHTAAVDRVLRDAGFVTWMPMRVVRTRVPHTRKWRDCEIPALPGYLFVRLRDADNGWQGVCNMRHVTGIISSERGPLAIPDTFVHRWRARIGVATAARVADPRRFVVGDKVRLLHGPFAMLEAEIVRVIKGETQGRLAVDMFGREIIMDVGLAGLEKCV